MSRCKPLPAKATALLALALFLSGCTTSQSLFYWGEYEKMLGDYYAKPGTMTAAEQVRLLQNTVYSATRANKPVGPGIYAHLGVAYADLGQQADAEAAFASEVALYPESKAWIEGMVKRARDAVRPNP